MRPTMKTLVLMVALTAMGATELRAQGVVAPETKGFVNLNVGAQPRRQSIATSSSVPIYGETATFTTSQSIGNGPIYDGKVGYRVYGNLAIAVGFSSFMKTGDSTVTASVPHPLFFNQFKTTTATATGLDHTERTVSIEAVYFIPVTDKIDIALSAGPAFVSVKQGYVSGLNVTTGTQDVTFAVGSSSATAKGGTIGFDGTYLFHRNVGVGLWVRYVGATATLDGVGDLKAGGFHAGLGARIRF